MILSESLMAYLVLSVGCKRHLKILYMIYVYDKISLSRFGPRFFSLDRAYDQEWSQMAKTVAADMDFGIFFVKVILHLFWNSICNSHFVIIYRWSSERRRVHDVGWTQFWNSSRVTYVEDVWGWCCRHEHSVSSYFTESAIYVLVRSCFKIPYPRI